MIFHQKCFSCYILLTDQISLSDPLLLEILGDMCMAILCFSVCDVINLDSLIFLIALRENCPNTEFFLVRIFPQSDWIQRDMQYLSVFSPYAGEYGPEKTPYMDTFHAVSSWFYAWTKCQNKNLNLLRTIKTFTAKQKTFFIIFKGFSVAKNRLRPEVTRIMSNRCDGALLWK